MATVPAKNHQPLHNFSLPFLKWGQRTQASTSHDHRRGHRNSPLTDSSDSDPNTCNKPHRSRNRTIEDAERKIDEQNGVVSPERENNGRRLSDADGEVKPWNLRPRRLAISTVNGDCVAPTGSSAKSRWLLRGVAASMEEKEEDEKKKKRRLWISLSKEEIDEDIYALTGSRPARRPKKRNRIVQKQVDNVFPGLYLVGISVDSYRV